MFGDDMQLYVPLTIEKADQRLVAGIASTDAIDSQSGAIDGIPYVGDIVDPSAVEGALTDYLRSRMRMPLLELQGLQSG